MLNYFQAIVTGRFRSLKQIAQNSLKAESFFAESFRNVFSQLDAAHDNLTLYVADAFKRKIAWMYDLSTPTYAFYLTAFL